MRISSKQVTSKQRHINVDVTLLRDVYVSTVLLKCFGSAGKQLFVLFMAEIFMKFQDNFFFWFQKLKH